MDYISFDMNEVDIKLLDSSDITNSLSKELWKGSWIIVYEVMCFFTLSLPMQLTKIDAENVTKMHLEDKNAIPYSYNWPKFIKYS